MKELVRPHSNCYFFTWTETVPKKLLFETGMGKVNLTAVRIRILLRSLFTQASTFWQNENCIIYSLATRVIHYFSSEVDY